MKATERVKRIPVGGPRDILTIANMDPNYVYRWFLSHRVERAKLGGYEVVVGDDHKVGQPTVDKGTKIGSALTQYGGTGGQTLVAMRIPKEWYDEDQAAKMEAIDLLEQSMKREAKEGRYGSFEITRR